jgi:hypothetical protein
MVGCVASLSPVGNGRAWFGEEVDRKADLYSTRQEADRDVGLCVGRRT